jgi:exodeoxyribonuclease III
MKYVKIAAWNVNSLKVRLPQLLDFLATRQPDAVCLQETKLTDENFPVAELEAAGYRVVFAGQKTYNGVAILGRGKLADVSVGIPGLEDEQKRVIAATLDGVRLVCVYCPNGQSLDSDKYPYKLAWFDALAAWLKDELVRYPNSPYSVTTTSPPKTATSTTPRRGRTACWFRNRNASASGICWRWA